MMPRIAITIVLGMILGGTTLGAQNNSRGEKNAARTQRSSRTFAERPRVSKPVKANTAVLPSEDEPVREQEPINFAFPYRAGIGPNAPLVCRHDDLSQDMEFRLCMNQLLDSSGSFRN